MMNINEVQKRIKQRPPFQMIEKVLEVEDGEYAKGIKCVSVNEPYFAGHFPDAPIMPGVLVIEACAQLCSITMESQGTEDDKIYVLLKCEELNFTSPAPPLSLRTSISRQSPGMTGLKNLNSSHFNST